MYSNIETHNIETVMLVDELSSTEIYIGQSDNGGNIDASNWKIKKILQVGSVWTFTFPNGEQKFEFIWSQRFSYTYG